MSAKSVGQLQSRHHYHNDKNVTWSRHDMADKLPTIFDLTRPELEYMTYCTRGEHANHYTTDKISKFNLLERYILLLLQAFLGLFILDGSFYVF
jgi:hypothetical protein